VGAVVAEQEGDGRPGATALKRSPWGPYITGEFLVRPTTACMNAVVAPAEDPRRSGSRRGSLPEAMTASELAAAWTRNVEQLCRLALMEFNDAEKLALRRRAGGGLLKSTQTDNSRA
jgi:hypothetical protein